MELTTRIIGFLTILIISSETALALENGMGLKPILGFSTWGVQELWADVCTETEIKQVAEAMMNNGMKKLGYDWIVLDDCWGGQRLSNGTYHWDETRFPSGMPALADWLHEREFKLEIYTSLGNVTCSNGGRSYPIPGSENYYQLDMDTFASWNIDGVKGDWCGDVHDLPIDGLLVGAKDYKALAHALNNTTPHRPLYFEAVAAYIFLLGETPNHVNAWRAQVIDHHDSWENTLEVIALYETAGIKGKPGAWAYCDVLMTGGAGCKAGIEYLNETSHCPGMTDEEYRTEFAFWWIVQSPLIVDTDVRFMTPIMNELLLNWKMIEIHQDTRTEPGWHIGDSQNCNSWFDKNECQIWARKIFTPSWAQNNTAVSEEPDAMAVVLLNLAVKSQDMDFQFENMPDKFKQEYLPTGWSNNTVVVAEELMGQNHIQDHTGGVGGFVRGHSVLTFLLTVKQPNTLISD